MKYSRKSHKDINIHKNRIKRSGQARLVYVMYINRNIPTTWRWARRDFLQKGGRLPRRLCAWLSSRRVSLLYIISSHYSSTSQGTNRLVDFTQNAWLTNAGGSFGTNILLLFSVHSCHFLTVCDCAWICALSREWKIIDIIYRLKYYISLSLSLSLSLS